MPEVIADYNKEGVFKFRAPSGTTTAINLIPRTTTATGLLLGVLNSDETTTVPTNYVYGGVGSVGPTLALKTTTGAPADTDFSGATPVVPVPPLGTAIYNTNTHKLYVRDAAASWLSSVALT